MVDSILCQLMNEFMLFGNGTCALPGFPLGKGPGPVVLTQPTEVTSFFHKQVQTNKHMYTASFGGIYQRNGVHDDFNQIDGRYHHIVRPPVPFINHPNSLSVPAGCHLSAHKALVDVLACQPDHAEISYLVEHQSDA